MLYYSYYCLHIYRLKNLRAHQFKWGKWTREEREGIRLGNREGLFVHWCRGVHTLLRSIEEQVWLHGEVALFGTSTQSPGKSTVSNNALGCPRISEKMVFLYISLKVSPVRECPAWKGYLFWLEMRGYQGLNSWKGQRNLPFSYF